MDDDSTPQQPERKARAPIEWRAHEYVHVEKTPDWYWALGLIGVAAAIAAIVMGDVLFAILILLAAFVLAIYANRQPNVVRFAVTQRGVRIDDELYPYNTLDSFAIDEVSPNHTPKLILKPKRIFASLIIIPVEEVDPDDVHDFISDFLLEEEHVEPLSHHVMQWLGF